jgi:hypothetical protein
LTAVLLCAAACAAYGKAKKARQELLDSFHGFIQQARAQVAVGEEAPGALGLLVAAGDEQGNRWVMRSLAIIMTGASCSIWY